MTSPADTTSLVPNSGGAKLICCTVSIERDPPTVSAHVSYLPIIAFVRTDNHVLRPLLTTGPLVGWGELRASTVGCFVYGVCIDDNSGVSTVDRRYDSVAEFIDHAKALVTIEVAKVREQKGWPAHQIPTTPADLYTES
jgi:hypothetical protein